MYIKYTYARSVGTKHVYGNRPDRNLATALGPTRIFYIIKKTTVISPRSIDNTAVYNNTNIFDPP